MLEFTGQHGLRPPLSGFWQFGWVDHEFLVRFRSTSLIFAPFFTTSMALLYNRGEKDARGKKEFSWKFFSFPV
jgi:hypothetical protein